MVRQMTCIMCPMGCELTVKTGADIETGIGTDTAADAAADTGSGGILVMGNTCPKGKEYAVQELTDPHRNIATSVLVNGGELPLVSVRLDHAIPKDRIFDVMAEIRKQSLEAPVKSGQVVIENVLGLGANVIATKHVERVQSIGYFCSRALK